MCEFEPVWASEVEPYPIAVTRSRFPTMKHLGDISKINGAEIEPVDVITFGSPCQDLSVAGKRAGLEGARSGLFMEAVRIIKEMREATDGKYPTFALWENVPGAFSSNKGEDFRVVLEELIKIAEPSAAMPEVPPFGWAYADSYVGDGWSLAYRVFDTQYWPGTPQRRRRIYLVADFRGQRAREVLFEREGLRGHLTESPPPRERVTVYVEDGSGAADSEGNGVGVVNAIGGNAENYHFCNRLPTLTNGTAPGFMNAVAYAVATQQGGAEVSEDGICPTVTAAAGMSGNNQPWICQPETAIIDNIGGQAEYGKMSEVNGTLRAGAQGAIAYCYDARGNGDGGTVSTITGDHENRVTDYTSVVMEPVVYNGENITSPLNAANPQQGDPCHTLGTDNRNYLVYAIDQQGGKGGANYAEEVMSTLCSDSHGTHHAVAYPEAITVHGETIFGSLLARDYKGAGRWDSLDKVVCCPNKEDPIALDRAFYNQGQNAQYSPQYYTDGTVPTLVAKGPAAVCAKYIVRRLTPTECARLQGFPDNWGHPDKKEELTEEEHRFWQDVRNTHATINGKAVKDYTKAQMLTWYNKLHSDSAEYKMWGNGIALPPSLYCMQGMEVALSKGETENDRDDES